MKLSFALIVKNESKYIEGCLNSIIDTADEIIIVDTGSTDNTKELIELCQNAKIKIYSHPWQNDFSVSRNIAKSYCSGDWCFSIDADERLIDFGLKPFLENMPANTGGCLIPMFSHQILPSRGGWNVEQRSYTRIFRNLPEFVWEKPLHETILDSITRANFNYYRLPEDCSVAWLAHLGYDISESNMKLKSERNFALYKKALQQNPADAMLWFQLGKEWGVWNDRKKQILCFKKALSFNSLTENIQKYMCDLINVYSKGIEILR